MKKIVRENGRLFIDIDGTLFNSQRTVSQKNIKVLSLLKNKGINYMITILVLTFYGIWLYNINKANKKHAEELVTVNKKLKVLRKELGTLNEEVFGVDLTIFEEAGNDIDFEETDEVEDAE